MKIAVKHSKVLSVVIIVSVVFLVAIVATKFYFSRFNVLPNLVTSITTTKKVETFPLIDEKGLTDVQISIVKLLKQEFTAQNPGTKYAEGVKEPWCADFVSWIMKEAGAPLSNPNSGSWRIPGTYTLRDYYETIGMFEPATSNYQPQVGDIVLYDNPSPFGQHTNVVIKNDKGQLVTIGGNENNKIHLSVHKPADDPGLIGYGKLRI